MTLTIPIINVSSHELPSYQTIDAAGMDLRAHLPAPLTLQPMQRVLVPTGLSIALPKGYEAQIRPRSGLAIKKGLTLLNSPGTIDADYRGEIKVIMVNLSTESATITNGERVAQMVVAQYTAVAWRVVEELKETTRGTAGFGSTGKQ